MHTNRKGKNKNKNIIGNVIHLIFIFIILKCKGPQGRSSCSLNLWIKKLKQLNKRRYTTFNPEFKIQIYDNKLLLIYIATIYKLTKKYKANLTRVLMLLFSWARLVIASAALLITAVAARELVPSLCLFNRSTRCDKAPASTMSCWYSGCLHKRQAD